MPLPLPPVAAAVCRVRYAAHRLPAPTNRSRRLIRLTLLLLLLHHRSLMEDDLPVRAAAAPDAGAARAALALQQRVGQQVDSGGERAAVEVAAAPAVLDRVRTALGEGLEHVLAAVAAARGTDLPEVRCHLGRERGIRAGEFPAVKDRLTALQLFEHRPILRQ